jgi:hypothetical protein
MIIMMSYARRRRRQRHGLGDIRHRYHFPSPLLSFLAPSSTDTRRRQITTHIHEHRDTDTRRHRHSHHHHHHYAVNGKETDGRWSDLSGRILHGTRAGPLLSLRDSNSRFFLGPGTTHIHTHTHTHTTLICSHSHSPGPLLASRLGGHPHPHHTAPHHPPSTLTPERAMRTRERSKLLPARLGILSRRLID